MKYWDSEKTKMRERKNKSAHRVYKSLVLLNSTKDLAVPFAVT